MMVLSAKGLEICDITFLHHSVCSIVKWAAIIGIGGPLLIAVIVLGILGSQLETERPKDVEED